MERMMDELSLVEGKTISNAGSGILGNNLGNVCLKGGEWCIFLETDFWGENFGNLGKVVEWGNNHYYFSCIYQQQLRAKWG